MNGIHEVTGSIPVWSITPRFAGSFCQTWSDTLGDRHQEPERPALDCGPADLVATSDDAHRGARTPNPRQSRHALAARPILHKDPFDRILIAQAIAEALELVTNR